VRLRPLGMSASSEPIVPAPDDDECGTVGGMRVGGGNKSTQKNLNSYWAGRIKKTVFPH
jgi:hypothetical protein